MGIVGVNFKKNGDDLRGIERAEGIVYSVYGRVTERWILRK